MNKILKGVHIESTEEKWVELKNGTYEVEGNIYDAGYTPLKVIVKNFDNVFHIRNKTEKLHYKNSDGVLLSVADYITKRDELYASEDNGDNYEDVYQYKHFINTWVLVTKNNVIKENVYIQIEKLFLDTGNDFIVPEFVYGGDNINVYRYNRKQAVIHIVKTVMAKLGVVYQDGVSYNGTSNKKIYSGFDTKRGIRYVVAFGSYVFNDVWDVGNYYRNTLEKCRENYNSDLKRITDIITIKHNKHFNIEQELDTKKLLELITNLKGVINRVDSKKATQKHQMEAQRRIRELYDLVNNVYL